MGMDAQTLQRFRETVKMFYEIRDEKIDALAEGAEKRFYRKGDFFSTPQNLSSYVAFTLQGLFRRYIIDKDGNEVTYNFIGDCNDSGGSIFSAYSAIIMNIIQPSYIQALDDSDVYVLPRDRLAEFWDADDDWKKFLQIVTECIFLDARNREEGLLMYDAKERYIKFLKENPCCANRIQLAHIASYLGISPVSLSRIRKSLRN